MKSNKRCLAYQMKSLMLATGIVSLLLCPLPSRGASEKDLQASDAAEVKTAPVKLDGNTLFYVVGITSFPPEQRAERIRNNIIKAASNPSIKPEDIRVVEVKPGMMKIVAADTDIGGILAEDAAIETIDLALLAEVIHGKIISAVNAYRHDRSRDQLIKNSLHALGALLGTLLTVLFLVVVVGKSTRALDRRIKSRVDLIEGKSFSLVRSAQIWRAIHFAVDLVKAVLIIAIIATCTVYCLNLFPWTRNVAKLTLSTFSNPVFTLGKGALGYLPNLVFLVVIFLFTRYLLKLFHLFFSGIEKGHIVLKNMDPDLAIPSFNLVRILIVLFAIVVAYPYIPGGQSEAFKALSVFLGVLISLGSSSFIGNFIAGYFMIFRKAFRKGDRIMVDGHIGFVEDQKISVTRIRTLKNEVILMPNSTLINSNIVNFSSKTRQTGVILHTTVGIGYETPWRQVDAILMLAADRTDGLLKDPPPFVLKTALGDFAINYEINAYCKDPMSIPLVYDELHGHILDVFNENNIQIMTPAYEGDPETPKVVPKDQWHMPAAGSAPQSVT